MKMKFHVDWKSYFVTCSSVHSLSYNNLLRLFLNGHGQYEMHDSEHSCSHNSVLIICSD